MLQLRKLRPGSQGSQGGRARLQIQAWGTSNPRRLLGLPSCHAPKPQPDPTRLGPGGETKAPDTSPSSVSGSLGFEVLMEEISGGSLSAMVGEGGVVGPLQPT